MIPYQNTTDEERRAAGYELRQSATGGHLVFHNLRQRANRPPDAVPTLTDLAMQRLDEALGAQRKWYETDLGRATKREAACKRTIKKLVWICGPVICTLFWMNVWLGWEYVERAAAWIWRLL